MINFKGTMVIMPKKRNQETNSSLLPQNLQFQTVNMTKV